MITHLACFNKHNLNKKNFAIFFKIDLTYIQFGDFMCFELTLNGLKINYKMLFLFSNKQTNKKIIQTTCYDNNHITTASYSRLSFKVIIDYEIRES